MNRIMAGTAAAIAIAAGAALALTAREMIDQADQQMRGDTSRGTMEMVVITPEWRRTMRMDFWEDAEDDNAFVRVLAPQKDRGTASLKIGNEMWTYMPEIERSMKIPPSMMHQSWMGSDFTNDDMVKSSSIVEDYHHEITDTTTIDGTLTYEVTLTPKDDAVVVWGSIVYYAREGDYLPVRQDYYDEDRNLVRMMEFGGFRETDGRVIPSEMMLVPLTEDDEGDTTIMRWLDIEFNVDINPRVFTRANLERSR